MYADLTEAEKADKYLVSQFKVYQDRLNQLDAPDDVLTRIKGKFGKDSSKALERARIRLDWWGWLAQYRYEADPVFRHLPITADMQADTIRRCDAVWDEVYGTTPASGNW